MQVHVILSEMICMMQEKQKDFKEIFSDNKQFMQKFNEVFSLSHKLIEKLIIGNKYTKKKVSEYINLFLY